MIKGYPPIIQALLGTLFTWGLTAAGAGLVVIIKGKQVTVKLIKKLSASIFIYISDFSPQ